MENRWLLMWLFAPIFSPGGMALEAYSLRWYRLDGRSDRDDRAANAVMAEAPRDERRTKSVANASAVGADTPGFGLGERAHILAVTIALALLAVSTAAAQDAPKRSWRCSRIQTTRVPPPQYLLAMPARAHVSIW